MHTQPCRTTAPRNRNQTTWRRNMMKHLRTFLLCLFAGIVFAASTTGMAAEKTYVAGVEASFPPWAYVENGKYKGIAIDAMRAIADDQGFKVEFKDLPFP